MKMKVEEMPRASEGDTIELEGKVFRLKEPNSNDFDGEIVWGQFIVLKDETGEQGCWLKLDSKDDNVTKGTQISIKGKLGKEYTEKRSGKLKRSINNCDFEVIGKVQEPAQSSGNGNGTKDNYWEKKFKYEVLRDPKVQLLITNQCAIKACTELAKIPQSKFFTIKVHTEKDYFAFADKIVKHIYGGNLELMVETAVSVLGGETEEKKKETKEERTKKAEEVVGETRFKPASTKQKEAIFGYTDRAGKYHKGHIDSRYIETDEIKKLGDPKKLSVEKASEWIEFWWGEEGNPEDVGARKQREIDNPRDENGKPIGALVKGDKTSVAKDIIVDEIYALRRENRLNDDDKFKEVMGYNPKIEELTEADCIKVKGLLKNYVPF